MKSFKDLDKKQMALLIFESVMSLFYPLLGIWMIVVNFFQLNEYVNIVLSILFIVYGIYRIYRTYKRLF
jgi:hypothetical protein